MLQQQIIACLFVTYENWDFCKFKEGKAFWSAATALAFVLPITLSSNYKINCQKHVKQYEKYV